MTSIKTVFKPSAVAAGMMNLYYYVKVNHTLSYIPANVSLPQTSCQRCTGRTPQPSSQLYAVTTKINQDLKLLQHIDHDFASRSRPYSAEDIANTFGKRKSPITFLKYMKKTIDQLQKEQRHGTARNYLSTLNSFRSFIGDGDICFESLTNEVIAHYEQYLNRRGICRNSSSFYIRILRAVCRKAERAEIAIGHQCRFDQAYTGTDQTAKRALPEHVIRAMYNLNLSYDPKMAFARDLFIFSYCARGMAFVDMAFLKKTDIDNGYIVYARKKTRQQLFVKLEPTMQTIMQRYSRDSKTYVFPIINDLPTTHAYTEYLMGINHYNYLLKKIGRRLNYNGKITSYSARHSWATIALSHDTPIYIISQGLGHESERTTRIYLSKKENRVLDAANADIIRSLHLWE